MESPGLPCCESRWQIPYPCRCTHCKFVRRYIPGHNRTCSYQCALPDMDVGKDGGIGTYGSVMVDHRPTSPPIPDGGYRSLVSTVFGPIKT